MTADRHQQVLSLAGRLASAPRPQAHVIADGTALKNVIPGGNAQNRDGDIRVVIFNRPAFPIIVVARMREPVEEIGSERARKIRSAKLGKIEQRIAGKRERRHSLGGIGFGRHLAVERILRQTGSPRLVEPLLEGPALVSPALVIVAGRDHRANAGEVRRMGDGGEHLGRTHVGPAKHPDFAVRVGKRRRPLHGVVAVVGFVQEWVPFAFGSIAAANILNEDHIPARGGFQAEPGSAVFVIGGPLE